MLTFHLNGEGHKFRVVRNYSRYGLKRFTSVDSSLRGVEDVENQSADKMNISGRTIKRNGEVFSTSNDIAPWIKPLYC